MNVMARDQSKVGFGMAICPEAADSQGVFVSRYDNVQSEVADLYVAQMEKQNILDLMAIDKAAFVPCPNTEFNPEREEAK